MRIIFPDAVANETSDGGTEAFDAYLNTESERADSLTLSMDADNCDRLMLFELDAYSVDLTLTDDDASAVVQSESIDLSLSGGLYQQYLVHRTYVYPNATLSVTINKAGGTAKCGLFRVGWSTYIGAARYGLSPGIRDYSIKDSGASGVYVSAGYLAKKLDIEVHFDRGNIDAVFEDLTAARATLVGIEANEGETNYDSLRLFGYFEDWEIDDSNPKFAIAKINFRGVI